MNIYYVYMYLRSKDSDTALIGTPYYIGKGSGRRAWRKGKGEKVKPPTNPENIVIFKENLTESEAFELEIQLIAEWGRIDNCTGILRNRTDGGDGSSGAIRTEEHKKIISETQRNRVHNSPSQEVIKKRADANRGKKRSDDFCKLMSEINKGKVLGPIPDNIKQKISASLKGKPKPPRSADHARKIKEALTGRTLTPEQIANRKKPIRKPMSPETKFKIGQANRGKLVGRHRSPESIKKQIETNKNKSNTSGITD